MKFALACNGTRGDCEPSVAIGRELRRRGHDVYMAIPPNLVGFAESAGLQAVPYGPNADDLWDPDFLRTFTKELVRNFWRVGEPVKIVRELWRPILHHWAEMSTTLTSLANGVDLLCTGLFFQDVAANVAEYYDIPFVTLHYFPVRPNGQIVPILPAPVVRSTMTAYDWFGWRMNKKADDEQRRVLGLPKATTTAANRIAERRSLEIQAYDEVCFPGLAGEWKRWRAMRPFVGSLSMDVSAASDDEVVSWIASGTPPICFGFGSMPVESPADTVAMIAAACAKLGERALICSGWTRYDDVPHFDHVKVVGAVSYASIFPSCRAVVHHGGSGTTAAALRAGVPALILWTAGDQPFWGAQLKRLKVGAARSFTSTTTELLIADLRQITSSAYVSRARELATRMTPRADSVERATDLVEDFARARSCV
ncbi:glycosyltransferase [Mycobacterium sp. DSM 3803]|nr:glycosyltransferase [Mycobacterium sp. DSM 3803]